MGVVRRTIPCGVVVLVASLLTGARVVGDAPWTPTISADPSHAILTGTVATSISLPATRYEILVGVPAQATVTQNDVAATSVRDTLARVVPDGSWTIIPLGNTQTRANAEVFLTGTTMGSYVRLDIDHALTDTSLRATMDAIIAAANEADFGSPLSGARIVSIGHGYASCAPFAAAAAVDAESQLQRIETRLGIVDGAGAVTAHPSRVAVLMDAPPFDVPLCGPDAHRRSRTTIETPARASFTMRSTYRFEQPMRFNAVRVPPIDSQPFVWDGPMASGITLELSPASGTLLTLEGYAIGRPRVVGIRYRYAGPFGVHRRPAVTPNALATLRDRLRSVGVLDSDITAQLFPDGAAIFVAVRRPDMRDREVIVRTLTVADRRGPDAVSIRPIFAGCSDDVRVVEEAVADATHRAARIAALLSATLDLRPIAVQVAPPPSSPCDDRDDSLGVGNDLLIPQIAETSPSHDRLMTRTVKVTFELQHPNLNGPVSATTDASTSWLFRSGSNVAIYPGETTFGEAERQTDLTATDLLFRFDIGADEAHDLAPVPEALTNRLASDLSLSRSSFAAASYWNGFRRPRDGAPVHGLRIVATIPVRGTATQDAISAALRDAAAYGYPRFVARPSRPGCEPEADALAVAAIRAAASGAHVQSGSRPLAIDLQGPYLITGTCTTGIGNMLPIRGLPMAMPVITLAARARVSFAAR